MSFTVSNSFIQHETISRMHVIKLFQLPTAGAAETTLNKWLGVGCSTVSVVSLLIHLLNESKKVFRSRLNACIPIVIVEQDSTMQGAA
jgi:hypothetical protein|tara:strand:+ start:118 stop:381 length:264 start_codon:yes stop_codon:yes gene_type:complete